jgi:hypothetical protein
MVVYQTCRARLCKLWIEQLKLTTVLTGSLQICYMSVKPMILLGLSVVLKMRQRASCPKKEYCSGVLRYPSNYRSNPPRRSNPIDKALSYPIITCLLLP